MSEKYKTINSSCPTFITLTIVGWVDLFIRKQYVEILDNTLNYYIQNKGLNVHAYVYMTSHIHLIVSSEKIEIQDFVRDFKKYTNMELIKAIKEIPESRREWLLNKFNFEAKRTGRAKNYKLWQDGFHPVILDTNKKREGRIKYIHYNPIDAGFVSQEQDWLNSSFIAYTEENFLLNVKIEPLF